MGLLQALQPAPLTAWMHTSYVVDAVRFFLTHTVPLTGWSPCCHSAAQSVRNRAVLLSRQSKAASCVHPQEDDCTKHGVTSVTARTFDTVFSVYSPLHHSTHKGMDTNTEKVSTCRPLVPAAEVSDKRQ